MKRLNNRQQEFLELLMQETDFIPIRSFAERMKVSTKTLKNDLKILREFLDAFGGEIYTKTGKGICLPKEMKGNIRLLNELRENEQRNLPNKKQRRAEILKRLLLETGKYLSLQKLSEEYYVGKSSIVNDLKAIEKCLEPFEIRLERSGRGTTVLGSEKNIREAILWYLHQESEETDDKTIDTYHELFQVDEVTLQNLLDIFRPEEVMFVTDLLEELQMTEDMEMNDICYKNLLTHILICIQRVREGNTIAMAEGWTTGYREKRSEDIHYRSAKKIADRIRERYGFEIGEEETEYIYQYICSLTTDGIVVKNKYSGKDISVMIGEALTRGVSLALGVRFPREEILMEGLMFHIKPMLNRLKYHIHISNPFLKEMLESYPHMIGVVHIVCTLVAQEFGLPEISIDETANLATYYQTMLIKQASSVTVLVVCQSGFGTSQLLGARLSQEFQGIRVKDVVSVRKLREMDLGDIDFVISTVPLDIYGVPYLVVSSFLSDQDISAIRNGIYLVEKKEQKAFEMLAGILTKEKIFFDSSLEVENVLCKAKLHEKLSVAVCRNEEATDTGICVDHASGRLEGYIIGKNIDNICLLLADFYHLALNEKLIDYLIQAESQEDFLKSLICFQAEEQRLCALLKGNILHKKGFESKQEVMDFFMEELIRRDSSMKKKQKALDTLLWERERMSFTGLGNGAALVHRMTDLVTETKVLILTLEDPIDWAEGKPYPDRVRYVRLIFLFLVPEKENEEVELIKELVLRIGKKEKVEQILAAADENEIIDILTKQEM